MRETHSNEVENNAAFRAVPRTGVIFVMTEAAKYGFSYGAPDWANLGQGAPETGELPGAPPRVTSIEVDLHSSEYAPVVGIPELRDAIAQLYNARYRRGMPTQYSMENVAVAGGGRLSLSRISGALGRTHVGYFVPDYTAYEEILDQFELFVPLPIPLDPERGYHFSAAELRDEIQHRGLSAVLLSNPSNPTGKLVCGGQLGAWVAAARANDCFLLMDEYYSQYIWDVAASPEGSVSAAAAIEDVNSDKVVIMDGLTKNWRYPGWRIGWTVGPRSVIDKVSSVGSFMDGGAPHPLQRAALPLLEPSHARQETAAIRAAFMPKRELMLKRLTKMGFTIDAAPAGAFYVWANLSSLPEGLRDSHSFFQKALQKKVIVVPGEFFDVNPGKRRRTQRSRFDGHVRISFGPAMEEVKLGLDRLEELINEER